MESGIKAKIKRLAYLILQGPNVKHMHKKFAKYRNMYLKQTDKEYNSIEKLKNNLPSADVYCTGSDQVWAKIGGANYDEAYFLDFVPAEKRCISYAASLGKSKIDEELEKRLPELLKKYETILVRENTAEEIIKKNGFNNVKQVLDPTLLLNEEEWSKLAEKTKLDGKEYILVYQLHHNKQMEDYLKKLKKHTKLPVYRIHPSFYYGFKPGKFIYLPTPGEYISYIKNAKYIVTDSFHGTVFSLIFNKNFVDILPGETSTRIESILKLVKQEKRIIKDFSNFDWLNNSIQYGEINKILKEEREKSLQDFENAIFKDVKNNVNKLNLKLECTGCRMCEQICPKNAIKMEEDEEGFIRPVVDKSLCINCGLCIKRCPQRNLLDKNIENQTAYAAKLKDLEVLQESSSGGIFSVLANEYIKNNGKIYGAAFDEKFNVVHVGVENLEGLKRLRGSKYVQAIVGNAYIDAKAFLKQGRKVMFSGTACQIAGLKKFLKTEYENLLTVDVVCHGVPSPLVWRQYLQEIKMSERREDRGKNTVLSSPKDIPVITGISFRDKKLGWKKFSFVVRGKSAEGGQNSVLLSDMHQENRFMQAFISNLILRPSCYDCKVKAGRSGSDITIADYWGIKNYHPEMDDDKGTSLVMVNTLYAQLRIDRILFQTEYVESDYSYGLAGNPSIEKSVQSPKYRSFFWEKFPAYGIKTIDMIYRKNRFDLVARAKKYIRRIERFLCVNQNQKKS